MMSQTATNLPARRLYLAAAAVAVLTFPALLLDLPVAQSSLSSFVPGDVRRILGWSELFAHGYGVALIGLIVFVLDPPRRRQIPRAMTAAYLAGLLANVLKFVVARVRPRYFAYDGGVAKTFLGWLPFVFGTGTPHATGFEIQSFPSGHTATAVGLAVGLASLYPRGRWLFLCFAALAAFQRIDVQAHYLSDTVAAAAIGFFGAACVMDRRGLGRWFDRFEARGLS